MHNGPWASERAGKWTSRSWVSARKERHQIVIAASELPPRLLKPGSEGLMSQVTALRSTSSLVISPPTVLVPDEPSTVESALLRLSPTSSWLPLKNKRLSWLRIRSASYKKSKHRLPIPVKEEGFESPWLQPVIEINGDPPTTTNGAGDNENTYIWAYLDENQRGYVIRTLLLHVIKLLILSQVDHVFQALLFRIYVTAH